MAKDGADSHVMDCERPGAAIVPAAAVLLPNLTRCFFEPPLTGFFRRPNDRTSRSERDTVVDPTVAEDS